MPCYSPLRGWANPVSQQFQTFRGNAHTKMQVPCGGCIGCRLQRVRDWSIRMTHEAHEHEANCFITLTYDPESLPWGGTLVKDHFQKFMKRLRKHFHPQKIKYYHCGEYGDDLDRPHYHACLFGLDFGDKVPFKCTETGVLYTSATLESLWPFGFSTIAEFTWETAGYTAGYSLKKRTGLQAKDHYHRTIIDIHGQYLGEIELEPEYATMSNGLGSVFYEKYTSDFHRDQVPVPGRENKVLPKIPRYYETMLKNADELTYGKIKQMRETFAHLHLEDSTTERLYSRYKVKKAQIQKNTRSYETGATL